MNRLGAFRRAGGVARMLGAVIAAAAVPAAHGQLVPGFYVFDGARGVALSSNGSAGAGTFSFDGNYSAVRWTLGPGTNVTAQEFDLQTPSGFASGVSGISADGSTLVGRLVFDLETVRPFRIGANGVVQNLGNVGSFQHVEARAANADGSVVVGYAAQPETFLQGRSWRWTQATGMQLLPNPVGGIDATASDMTPDGSVIAGYAYTFTTKAMVWRNGMAEFLGTVPGTPFGTSYAFAVSDDGQVVVGRSDVPGSNGAQAVRWVGNEPLQLVPASMAASSLASALNGDGSLIGGSMQVQFQPPARNEAFLWTLETGTVFAKEYFAERGITVPDNYRLSGVNSISADGTVFSLSAVQGNGQQVGVVVVVPAPPICVALCVSGILVSMRRRGS